MALLNPIHGEMSGSIGANTYSHNKGGSYVRLRAIPTNPNSAKQQQIRSILQTLSAAWRALTTDQQTGWANWAALNPGLNPLGLSFFRSGAQAYVGLNSRVVLAGDARIDDPPTAPTPAELSTVTIVATAPDQVAVTWTPTPLAAGERLYVWGSLPGSAGRNPNFRQSRLIGIGPAADASPTTITSPYPAIATNVSNFYVARMGADGQISVFQKVRVAWV